MFWRNRAISSGRSSVLQRVFAWALFCAMAVALAGVFLYAPRERTMGDVQRIFYFHVSSAWVSFLAFFVVCVGSIGFLATRQPRWDHRAAASAELGVLFCSLVLITGPIWAKSSWDIWWTWDARLTTTLVLWLIYVAYLMLRSLVAEPVKRATLSAVVGIIGFVDVPIVYGAIRWWRTHHPAPVILGGEASGLEPRMRLVFFFCLAAFTLLYFFLLDRRLKLAHAQNELDELYRQAA